MLEGRRQRVAAAGALAALIAAGTISAASAWPVGLTNVASAEAKAPGLASPNQLSPELDEAAVAQGSWPLENPSGAIKYYGYLDDGPLLPAFGSNVEASKTEPDKNTYLVLGHQHGADASYDYGRHFLFQGHEVGAGYITRINLDADPAHRITLLASTDRNGLALPVFDGSVWDPFARRLLFSAELGTSGGIWQATDDFPSTVEDISGAFGRGGFEGMQVDSKGNVWVVEDSGGPTSTTLNKAKQPNSFVYRFVPKDPSNLTRGRLQVLQVIGQDHHPIVFGGTTPAQIDADITSQAMADLHTYGLKFDTNWVTIHDTATDGTTPFDANALAKAKSGTPFKRPENGQFRPASGFRDFIFSETGDTNADSVANATFGGWGALMRLQQAGPGSNHGTLSLFFKGDKAHTGFDNLAFLDGRRLLVVEDAGDTLHTQRNALDSGYVFDVLKHGTPTPIRFLAEGRDASATIDSGLAGSAGFHNEGDNEITGIHVSDGDPTIGGLLGRTRPDALHGDNGRRWRIFWTQQHGDNVTYEILASPGH